MLENKKNQIQKQKQKQNESEWSGERQNRLQ